MMQVRLSCRPVKKFESTGTPLRKTTTSSAGTADEHNKEKTDLIGSSKSASQGQHTNTSMHSQTHTMHKFLCTKI